MEKITKDEVESIIWRGRYDCVYRMDNDTVNKPYDGCVHNLIMILWEDDTDIYIAEPENPDFKEDNKTIVMNAPCMDAVILIRIEE